MHTDSAALVNSARVGEVLKDAKASFLLKGLESPESDAEWLMMSLLHCARSELFTNSDLTLSAEQVIIFNDYVERRISGEPPQYIVGEAEFFGRTFLVNPNVLIPRPETEILINEAIAAAGEPRHPGILDIGTGSGNIAITLAKEIPHAAVKGIDISAEALAVAEENKNRHHCNNLAFAQLDILKAHPEESYDIIVSNPPYIPMHEMDGLMTDVKDFEPTFALTDESDGLTYYKRITAIAQELLTPGGWVIAEVGGGEHSNKVMDIFRSHAFQQCELSKDYNGVLRVLKAQFCG